VYVLVRAGIFTELLIRNYLHDCSVWSSIANARSLSVVVVKLLQNKHFGIEICKMCAK